MNRDLIAEFSANAEASGAAVYFAPDISALNKIVEEIVSDGSIAFCPATTLLEKSVIIPDKNRTRDYTAASVVIEEVSSAVAESGAVVVLDHEDRPIQASMICDLYAALVNQLTIVPTLEDLFNSFSNRADMPANLTLITGPSRTADIEKTLVVGMHGPSRVTIIIVRSE